MGGHVHARACTGDQTKGPSAIKQSVLPSCPIACVPSSLLAPRQGRKFHAHRIALLASSDAFHAMFSGGYREKEASSVEIPNIPWDVFESMMRYIYTGNVEVQPELANELLQASDQYLLDGEACLSDCMPVFQPGTPSSHSGRRPDPAPSTSPS